jgi:hypothetical protein
VCVLLLDSSEASQVLLNQNIELMGCCCCCCCWRMQEKAFGAPCPTRFANHVFCLEDVVRSKQAFQLMVIDHRWEEASSSVAGKEELLRIITGGNNTRFWQEAEVVLEITKPIKDAIHTVETDKPLLSQMLPLYEALGNHLQQQHDTGSPAVKRLKLPDLLDKRMCGAGGKGKLWHSSFSASYLLDPMQWVKDRAGDWGPNFSKLSAAQLEEAEQCVIRITPEDQQETVKAEWEALRFDGFDQQADQPGHAHSNSTAAATRWQRHHCLGQEAPQMVGRDWCHGLPHHSSCSRAPAGNACDHVCSRAQLVRVGPGVHQAAQPPGH